MFCSAHRSPLFAPQPTLVAVPVLDRRHLRHAAPRRAPAPQITDWASF